MIYNDVDQLVLVRSDLDSLERISKTVAAVKGEFDTVSVRQTQNDEFLIFIEPDESSRWAEGLEGQDVEFRILGNVPPAFVPISDDLKLFKMLTSVLDPTRIALIPALLTSPTVEKAQDCRQKTRIKSDEAQGTASEVTLISDISPETKTLARRRVILEAAKEAAAAMHEALASGCKCKTPCTCRYIVTFGQPTDGGTTTNASGSVSREIIGGVSVTVSVGKVSTASASVNWTLWKTCVQKGDAGFDKTPPPEGETVTTTVGGTGFSTKCETNFKTDKVVVVKEYTDDITWTDSEPAAVIGAALTKLREEAVKEVLQKAAEAAGEALIALDVCSTDCPKQKVDMFISPPTVTTGRWFKRAYAVGYEYVKQVAASCEYWLYRQCTK